MQTLKRNSSDSGQAASQPNKKRKVRSEELEASECSLEGSGSDCLSSSDYDEQGSRRRSGPKTTLAGGPVQALRLPASQRPPPSRQELDRRGGQTRTRTPGPSQHSDRRGQVFQIL